MNLNARLAHISWYQIQPCILTLALFFTFFTFCLKALAANSNPWAEIARSDLKEIHSQLKQNHPGSVDQDNPKFAKWLESGLRESLDLTESIYSYEGAIYAERRYVNGFNDGHLNFQIELMREDLMWAGLIVSLRTGKNLVYYTDSVGGEVPPLGSELVSCDGLKPDDILMKNIFPYSGNSALESQKISYTPWLFLDFGNPFIKRPKICVFKSNDKETTIALNWVKAARHEIISLTTEATFKSMSQLENRRIGKNGFWFSFPTFNLNPENVHRMKNMYDAAKTARNATFVVLDVRGNTGGSSEFGVQFLKALYGDGFAAALHDKISSSEHVDWRASPENADHLEKLMPLLEQQLGSKSDHMKWFIEVLSGIRKSVANSDPFYREPDFSDEKSVTKGDLNPLFLGKVFFLTDGACFSACLDFADLVLQLPHVTQVGMPTWADTRYMEVRSAMLPSGMARLRFPIKVYRNRARGDNVPYIPSKRFYGNISDTKAVEAWLEGIEN